MGQIHYLSLSTHYLMMLAPTEAILATGTGFLYQRESMIYLITNGHNVTRLNPETNERISKNIAYPVKIKTQVRIKHPEIVGMFGYLEKEIHLYQDEDYQKPIWFVHPKFGYSVDVIAIPLVDTRTVIHENYQFYPINNYSFQDQFDVTIADEIYILGYPFNILGDHMLPIWKRASVASEPSVDINGLPKYLVDTATKSGMSGSPVIMRRTTVHKGTEEKNMIIGTVQNFAGIYSGRIGVKNELEAQLGIVWKRHLVDEIIDGKKLGSIDFQDI